MLLNEKQNFWIMTLSNLTKSCLKCYLQYVQSFCTSLIGLGQRLWERSPISEFLKKKFFPRLMSEKKSKSISTVFLDFFKILTRTFWGIRLHISANVGPSDGVVVTSVDVVEFAGSTFGTKMRIWMTNQYLFR